MAAVDRLALEGVRRPSVAVIAVSLNLLLTLPLAAVLNLWQDEAYTLQSTAHGVGYAFHEALAFEQNAPLYFVLMVFWRHLSENLFFLRLSSILCGAATVALIPALVKRYIPKGNLGFVTLAVAWNPFLIWAAVELRVYALVILLSALLMLLFFDGFLADRRSTRAAVLYALCIAVALYTQYYLAFLVAAQGAAMLLYRRSAWRPFFASAFAAAILFVPMLIIVPSQVANFRGAFAPPPSVFHSAAILASILWRYVLPLGVPHATVLYIVLSVMAVGAGIAGRRFFHASGSAPVVVMLMVAVLIFAAGAYAGGVHILNRHAASLFVPVMLAVFAAFTFLRSPLDRRAASIWFALAMIVSVASLIQTYYALAKPGDWIRSTSYLSAREAPGEPILIFQAENALPFAYYYHGPNRVIAVPEGVDFSRYDVTRFVVKSNAQLQAVFPKAKHLWLITAGECVAANISFGCGAVERYVASNYKVESDRAFFGSRVRLIRPVEQH